MKIINNEYKTFLAKVSGVLSVSIVIQIIPIIILPVLTKYLNNDLATYFLWQSVLSIIVVLGTARLDMAIFVANDIVECKNLIRLIFFISTFVGVIIFLLFKISSNLYILNKSFLVFDKFALSIILSCISQTIIQGIISLQIYYGNFKRYNLTRVLIAVFVNGLVFIAAISTKNISVVIYSHTLIILVISIQQVYQEKISLNILQMWHDKVKLYLLFKQNYRFPLFSLPADFINNLSNQLPVFIISSKYPDSYLVYYSLIIRTLSAPIGLIATSFLSIFKEDAGKEFREKGNCIKSYEKLFLFLLVTSIPIFITLYYLLPLIFTLLFGNTYKIAGEYAQLMIPLFFFRFIASPLSYTLYISNNQIYDLIWQVFLLILIYLSFKISLTFKISIIYFTISYSLMYLVYLFISFKSAKNQL